MADPQWRNLECFPAAAQEWSSYYPLLNMRVPGEKRVRKHLNTALPTYPILLSSPATNGRYLPPGQLAPHVVDLRLQKVTRHMAWMMFICIPATILLAIGVDPRILSGPLLTSVVSVTLYVYFNYRLAYTTDALAERWQFYAWCFARGTGYVYGFLGFMLCIGAAQLLGGAWLGSTDNYLQALGMLYVGMPESGEWWRVVTGTLLHAGNAHWLANSLVGAGLIYVYGPVSGPRVMAVIAVTAILSFITVYVTQGIWPSAKDGMIGISGGIGGMVGYQLAANLRYRSSFPDYFYITTMFVAAITLLIVSLQTQLDSFIVHLSGCAYGLMLGCITRPVGDGFLAPTDASRDGAMATP